MPGSTALFQTDPDEEESKNSEQKISTRQPPPVAPRTTSVTLQSWQSVTSGSDSYEDNKHARSASMDSLESSGSSSSGGGSSSLSRIIEPGIGEYIPTRTAGKAPKLSSHNPLQFVKVHSPLYKKAELQIKLTKEVKITREALKEGEEEWQSNLDNWKSRRRKVTEKVIQRAEEIRQCEAEEQLRQEQCLFQQRKIKKFSEIVERRSSRSYNLDLYIGQGDDSGLGGTPEPDDVIDSQSSILRSDTSEGMTSEAESIDSDTHKSDKILEKEAPIVPQKPHSWHKQKTINIDHSPTNSISSEVVSNISSAEPSDIEGLVCDSETISSEEDACFGENPKFVSDIENMNDRSRLADQDFYNGVENKKDHLPMKLDSQPDIECSKNKFARNKDIKDSNKCHSFKICIKPGDNKGFGFSVKGGKDQGCIPYIESVLEDGPASILGLKEGDTIVSLNGDLASTYSHASIIFTIKQAVYMGILDIGISRSTDAEISKEEMKTSSNKKSSFAEKLALFSSGGNSSSDKTKSSQTSKPNVKSESLVLRRRSAFENDKSENVIQRRSSCLFEEASNLNCDTTEKRLSVDLTSQTFIQKNGFKKDPPPPVPAKPKLKQKSILKTETTNIYKCDKSFAQANLSGTNHTIKPISLNSEADSGIESIKEYLSENIDIALNEDLRPDFKTKIETECDKEVPNYLNSENERINLKSICPLESPTTPICTDMTVPHVSYEHDTIDEVCIESIETNISDYNEMVLDPTTEMLSKLESQDLHIETYSESNSLESDYNTIYKAEANFSVSFNTSTQITHCDVPSVETESFIPESKENYQNSDLNNSSGNICEKSKHNLDESHISAYNETYDINNVNDCNSTSRALETDFEFQDPTEDVEFESDANQFKSAQSENFSTIENLSENISILQINPSPLCLPLEKADEDDVISASTTTSSETPDTETVIETLPSNLSPLPNDESNGEDSSNHLNGHDQLIETSDPEAAQALETLNNENTDPQTLENSDQEISNQHAFITSTENLDISDNVFMDNEDEEYRMELEESLDQITSLDVIDEIEQRLMQQLEQQDNFEEIDESLTMRLEHDMNKEWMYYSEEELLEDLTPRNREPPQEPPPPPPIEPEITEEILPMTRTNSTKRIKKELWRRRSDFLGLDSPEGIDVDNILPPPPGLEEILKLEREQNQWFEKRLSLVEADVLDSTPSSSSACFDNQDIDQNEYSSNYLLEDEGADSRLGFDATSDSWKENLEEENGFELGNESQPVSDFPNPISDENTKLKESPQHKAKQHIQNLGAAPKAKIMDSNKWITEKVVPANKRSAEPVFRQASYNENYWLAQDVSRRRSLHSDIPSRRYSMTTHINPHPDVTLRTWDDRESEIQKQRPKSAVWNSGSNDGNSYDSEFCRKQDIMRTHSLDDRDEMTCDTGVLESEVHQCSCCGKGLCEGSAMGIEALRLYFHIECFRCCTCQMLLGNGLCGTDVQVKNNQLYCYNCFTVD